MVTPVPWPIFIDYLSLFTPWYNIIIVDNICLSTLVNDSSACSLCENTILSEIGDKSATKSSDVPALDSGSSHNKSLTSSNFVVCTYNDGSIEYGRMSSLGATAEGLVVVPKSKIPVVLENGN